MPPTSGQVIRSSSAGDRGVNKRKRSESLDSEKAEEILNTCIRLLPLMPPAVQEEINKLGLEVQISSLTRDKVIEEFSLNGEAYIGRQTSKFWDIGKGMPKGFLEGFVLPPPSLRTFQSKYMEIADRDSDAVRRTLFHVIMVESIFLYVSNFSLKEYYVSLLTISKNTGVEKTAEAAPRGRTTRKRSTVKRRKGKAQATAASEQAIARSRVSFDTVENVENALSRCRERQRNTWLTLVNEIPIEYENEKRKLRRVYRGLMDCVSITQRPPPGPQRSLEPGPGQIISSKRSIWPLFSVLVIVDAKRDGTHAQAFGQIFSHLAVLHESRKLKKWADASAYGILITDLYCCFYKITHTGTVMDSAAIDFRSEEGLAKLIRAMVYVMVESVRSLNLNSAKSSEGENPQPDIICKEDIKKEEAEKEE
ncbi:hypothetical protein Dda_1193 [Drechslerella dactyloides]|uniref:Uncharacterized protein n=1 Tax=Drechslerella dactyloides TaxID=74499 RepID=A0AAD6J5R3_DREDA|nr:hypothetical protein Dda_1193 [Drechslerella dactyloides]